MSMLRVFKSHFQSTAVLLPSGKPCHFVNGVYRTNDEGEIALFEREIAAKHPHLFIDPNEREVDENLIDPMAALEHRIRQKILAEMAAADPNRDMGESPKDLSLNVASTRDIEEAAAGGSGMSSAARLMALRSKLPVIPGPGGQAAIDAAAVPSAGLVSSGQTGAVILTDLTNKGE